MIRKVELHCHIEGAAPPELIRKLAKKYDEDLSHLFDNSGNYYWSDFTSFLNTYDAASSIFREPEDFEELAYTYYCSSANQDAIYCEIFISPDHAKNAGLSYESYVDGLSCGLNKANQETGIEGRMIVVGIRHFGVEAVEEAAKIAVAEPHPLVTGFGMAGDERFGHISDFVNAFETARESGLSLTCHAGEFGGPESVSDTLDCLKLKRVGHGVRSIEDPNLVARLAEEKVVLELCPSSNIAMGLYESLEKHPIRQLKQAGVAITVSSDDPPHFGSSIGYEYDEIEKKLGWDESELTELTRTAIDSAFCDEDCKSRLRSKLGQSLFP